jgi:hypothetical protein
VEARVLSHEVPVEPTGFIVLAVGVVVPAPDLAPANLFSDSWNWHARLFVRVLVEKAKNLDFTRNSSRRGRCPKIIHNSGNI